MVAMAAMSASMSRTAWSRNLVAGASGDSAGSGGVVPAWASAKPQSPKLGTCTWYGVAARPAASRVEIVRQKAVGVQ